MTTITGTLTTTMGRPRRRVVPTSAERLLLTTTHRLETLTLARMERRATKTNLVTEKARREADERRRTAQALGGLGLLPR